MYSLHFPGVILFGVGSRQKLPEQLGSAQKILLVTGRSARGNGILEQIHALLPGKELVHADCVSAEPQIGMVDELLRLGRMQGVSAVVAVGGGSVIDAGKTAAILMATPELCADYFYGRKKVPDSGLPFFALPTTAGTGAEVTPNAVLTDPATGLKQSIRSLGMYARAAIVDPDLTASCPFSVAAASGMDALTQGIEAYLSNQANAVSRSLAHTAVRLLLENLETACFHPENTAARSAVSEGCLLGAMAFSQTGLGAVHGLAHPLGSALHIGHGETCAILLPTVLRWNRPVVGDRMAELDSDLTGKVTALRERLQLATNFRAFGITPAVVNYTIAHCRSGSMKCNPRLFSDEEIAVLLKELS